MLSHDRLHGFLLWLLFIAAFTFLCLFIAFGAPPP